MLAGKADELYDYINTLKCEMLTTSGNGICENNGHAVNYHPWQIINKDNTDDVPMQVLFGNDAYNKLDLLKTKMRAYLESLQTSGKMNADMAALATAMFDVNNAPGNNGEENALNWEQREFPTYQLIVVLDVLSQIQSNVKIVESELLAASEKINNGIYSSRFKPWASIRTPITSTSSTCSRVHFSILQKFYSVQVPVPACLKVAG